MKMLLNASIMTMGVAGEVSDDDVFVRENSLPEAVPPFFRSLNLSFFGSYLNL